MATQLSAQLKSQLIKRVLDGEKISTVCRKAGVSRTIFYRWLVIYKDSGFDRSSRALQPHIQKGKKHYRGITLIKEYEILKLAKTDPFSSIRFLAGKTGVSRHCVWSVLKRNNLTTIEARCEFSTHSTIYADINTQTKLALLRRYEAGEKVTILCREFGFSRTIFYRWLKRYKDAKEVSSDTAVANMHPHGAKHYRYNEKARIYKKLKSIKVHSY